MKPLFWIASSLDDLREFPDDVKDVMGFALFQAQQGAKHVSAKPLHGFGGAGVLEVVDNHRGNTFRTVYAVEFVGAVYVLHAFQKKSKRGKTTSTKDVETIKHRLKVAEKHHRECLKAQSTRRDKS